MIDRLRDCGLLSAGEVTCDRFDLPPCEKACLLGDQCSDLSLYLCGMESDLMYACFAYCDAQTPRILCNSGKGVPVHEVCNGIDDCDEGEDELDCPQGTFAPCADSSDQYVVATDTCDGVDDCADGTDEANCPAGALFTCDDGSRVPSTRVCDLVPDCVDGSDERGCATLICEQRGPLRPVGG